MPRPLVSVLLLFLLVTGGQAQTNALWFPVGEETIYDVHWGFLPVARSHVTTSWTNFQGRQVIAIRYVTRTNKVVAQLYPVDDLLETLIDPDTFLPIRYTKKTREGHTYADEVTDFDHAGGTARWESFLKKKTKNIPIGAETRDVIALMYWLRRTPFRAGTEQTYQVLADNKIYDLVLKLSEGGAVALDRYGKVNCLRIDPVAAFNGLFERKGKLQVWVSKDARQLCTRIVGEVPVASISITLAEVRGPGQDAWVAKPAKSEDK